MKSTMVKEINGQLLTQDSVIEVHEKLVHHVSKRFEISAANLGLEYEDLVSVGFRGLLKAFRYFDGDKFNVRFSTYAVPMIRGEIQRFLLNQNPGLHYSRGVKELAYRIKIAELEESSAEVIAKALDSSVDKAAQALKYMAYGIPTSFDKPLYTKEGGGEEVTFHHVIVVEDDSTKLFVDEFVSSLTEMEQQIVKGLLAGNTQNEIAEKIGVCQVSVSRYKKKLRAKYLAYFNNENPVLALA